jgi:hypothetical protein
MICLQAVFAMLQALIKTCRVLDPAFEDTLFRLLGDAVRSLRCGSLSRSIVTKYLWHIADYQTPLSMGLTLCLELVADRPAAARPDAIHIMLGLALATGLLETIVDVCDRLITCDQSLALPAAVRDDLLGDFAAKIASVLPLWKRAYVPLTPHPSGDNVPPIAIAAFVLAQLALLADQLVVDPSPVDRFEEGSHSFDVAVRLAVSLSGASFGNLLRLVERVVDAEHLRRVVEAAAGSTSDSLGDEFAPPHTAPDEFVAMRVSVLHSTIRLMRLHVALVAAVPTRARLAPALLEKLRGVARGVFERRVLPRGVASDDAVVSGELSLSAALLLASAAPLLYDTPATRSRLLQTLLANVADGKDDDENGARSALVERLMEQFADPQRLAPLVDSGLDVSLLASRVTAVVVTRAVKLLDGAPSVALERANASKDAATTTTAVANAAAVANTTVATTTVATDTPAAADTAATTAAAAGAAVPVVIFDGPRHSKTYGGVSLVVYDLEGLVDIASDCKWTASSSLASRRPHVVADASRTTFWQSNDSSPHTLRAAFKTPAQVCVVSIMNDDDRSFTPRTISVSLVGADGSKIAERTQVRVRHESSSSGWFDVSFQCSLPPASGIAIDFLNQRSGGVDVRVRRCAVFVYPFAVPSGGGASATADKVDWSQVIEHPPAPSNMLLMSLAVCCASKRTNASAPLLASELAACVVVVERAAAIVVGSPSAQLLHLVLRLVRGSIVGVVVPAQILAFGDSLMATSDADTACVEAPLRRLALALEPLIATVRATTATEPAAKALKAAQTRCPAEHVCEMAAPSTGDYAGGWVCDECAAELPVAVTHMHCVTCSYDRCGACDEKLNPPQRDSSLWASIGANQQFLIDLHLSCLVAVAERARYAVDAIARADLAPQLMARDVPTAGAHVRSWLHRAPLVNGAVVGDSGRSFDDAVAAAELAGDVASVVDAMPRGALLGLDKPSACAVLALAAVPLRWHGGTTATLSAHAAALLRWFVSAKQQAAAAATGGDADADTVAPAAAPASRDVLGELRARATLLWSCAQRGDATSDVLAFLRDGELRDAAEVGALWRARCEAAAQCGVGMARLAKLVDDAVERGNNDALLTLCSIVARRLPRFDAATASAARDGLEALTVAMTRACAHAHQQSLWAVAYHVMQFFVRDLASEDDFRLCSAHVVAAVLAFAEVLATGPPRPARRLLVTPERRERSVNVEVGDIVSGAWLAFAHIARSAARAPASSSAAGPLLRSLIDKCHDMLVVRQAQLDTAEAQQLPARGDIVALLAIAFESPHAWPSLAAGAGGERWLPLAIALLTHGCVDARALLPRIIAHGRNAGDDLSACDAVSLLLESIGSGAASAAQVSLPRFERVLAPAAGESDAASLEATAADCVAVLHRIAAVSDEWRDAVSRTLVATAAGVGTLHAELAAPLQPQASAEQLLESSAASKTALSPSAAQALCRGIGALTVLARGGATLDRLAAAPHSHLKLLPPSDIVSATCSPTKHSVLSHFGAAVLPREPLPRSEAPWPVRVVVHFGSVLNIGALALSCSHDNCDATYVSAQLPRVCIWRRRVDDDQLELVHDERDVAVVNDWAFVRATGNVNGAPWCARTDELTIELYLQSTHVSFGHVRVYELTYHRVLGDAPLCANLLRAGDATALGDAMRSVFEASDDTAVSAVIGAAAELRVRWAGSSGTHSSAKRAWERVVARTQLCALTRAAAVRAVHVALQSPVAFAALRERLQPLLLAATRALPHVPAEALLRAPLSQLIDASDDKRGAVYVLTEVESALATERSVAEHAKSENGHADSLDLHFEQLYKVVQTETRTNFTANTALALLTFYRSQSAVQSVLREFALPAIAFEVITDLCANEQEAREVMMGLGLSDVFRLLHYDNNQFELSADSAAAALRDVQRSDKALVRAVVVRKMVQLIRAGERGAAKSSGKSDDSKSKKKKKKGSDADGDGKHSAIVSDGEALPLWRALVREFTSSESTLAMLVTAESRERRKLLRDAAARLAGGSSAESPAPPPLRDDWELWSDDRMHWSGAVAVRLADEREIDSVEPFHLPTMTAMAAPPRRSSGFSFAAPVAETKPLDKAQRLHEQRARQVRRAVRPQLVVEQLLARAEGQALDVDPDGADDWPIQRRVNAPLAGWNVVRQLNGFAAGETMSSATAVSWTVIRKQHAAPDVVPLAELLALETAKLRNALTRHLMQRCALAVLADWTSHGAPLPPHCSLREPRSWSVSNGAASVVTAPLSDAQQLRLLDDVFDVAHTARRPLCFAASHDEPHLLHASDELCGYVADTLEPATPFARASLERLRTAFELQLVAHVSAALASGAGTGTSKRSSSKRSLALSLPEQLLANATQALLAFRTESVPLRVAAAHKSVLRACWVLHLLLDAALPLFDEALAADTVDTLRRAVPFVARLFADDTVAAAMQALRQCTSMLTAAPIVDVVSRVMQHQRFFKTAPDLAVFHPLFPIASERKAYESSAAQRESRTPYSFELLSLIRCLLLVHKAHEQQTALADVRRLAGDGKSEKKTKTKKKSKSDASTDEVLVVAEKTKKSKSKSERKSDEKKDKKEEKKTEKKKSEKKTSKRSSDILEVMPTINTVDVEELQKAFKFCEVRARPAALPHESMAWFFEEASLIWSIAAARRSIDSEELANATSVGGGALGMDWIGDEMFGLDDDPDDEYEYSSSYYSTEEEEEEDDFVDDDDIDSREGDKDDDDDDDDDADIDDDGDSSVVSAVASINGATATAVDTAAPAAVREAIPESAELSREAEVVLMTMYAKRHELTAKQVARSPLLRRFALEDLQLRCLKLDSMMSLIGVASAMVDFSVRDDVQGPLECVLQNRHLLMGSTVEVLLRRQPVQAYVSAIHVRLDRLHTGNDTRLAGDDGASPITAAVVVSSDARLALDDASIGAPPTVVVGHAFLAPPRAPKVRPSVLQQAASQLASIAPGFLARHDDTLFAAKFLGEAGADAGGVYREAMSMICRDVMAGEGELCVPTPNARFNVGERRGDRLPVLRGDAKLPLSERILLFEFLGMLIGHAARRDALLDLDFPLIFWKQLVGEETTLDDLAEYDAIAYESLRRLSEAAELAARALARSADAVELDALCAQLAEVIDGLGDESQFVATLSSGATVTLRRGGELLRLDAQPPPQLAERPVAERLRVQVAAVRAFVAESVAARCNESYGAARHVRRGMARLVPLALVHAFRGAQFARRVCGESKIDLEELRRHTSAHAGKPMVDMLFEVLAKFSNADQRRFVQFVYGQSRLPTSFENVHFSVQRRTTHHDPDKVLPTAGTCDFSISLPRYTSAAVMEERLLFAIRNCVAIDTDGSASDETDSDDVGAAAVAHRDDVTSSMSGSSTGDYSYEYESEYTSDDVTES